MSSRRNFFKKLGGGLGAVLLSDKIVEAFELEQSPEIESTIKGIPEGFENVSLFDPTTALDRKLTDGFFKYLKENNVAFKWERTYSPVFELKSGEGKQVVSRKLRTNYQPDWKNTEILSEELESWSGCTIIKFQPKTEKEYHEYLYRKICRELHDWKREKYYIYQLTKMPQMIVNSNDFNSISWLMIRFC